MELEPIKTEVFRDRNGHELQALRQKHLDIMRLHFQGFKDIEIAEALEVSEPTVRYTLNSAMVKERLALMNAVMDEEALEIRKRLSQGSGVALDVAFEIMTDTKEKNDTRLKAAFGWLDRDGHSPRREGGGGGRITSMEELRQRLLDYKTGKVEERTVTRTTTVED